MRRRLLDPWVWLAVVLGLLVLLVLATKADALDRPATGCHRVSAEQFDCRLVVHDDDGTYKVRTTVVDDDGPQVRFTFNSKVTGQ